MLLEQISSLVCHQSAERSLQMGGEFLPLCSRCTGIYSGFILGIAYQFLFWRLKIKNLPIVKISIVAVLFIVILITDSLGSYLKLWSLSNHQRLFLGLFGGSSISLFIFPVFNYSLLPDSKKDTGIKKQIELFLLLFLLGLGFFLILFGGSLSRRVISFTSSSGIIVLYLMLNTIIGTKILKWKNHKSVDWQKVLLLIGIVLFLTCLEFYLLYKSHLKF